MLHDLAESTAILISKRHERSESALILTLAEVRALLSKALEFKKSPNEQIQKA
jgi:hypothetical protein